MKTAKPHRKNAYKFKVLTPQKRSKIETLAIQRGLSLGRIAFEIGVSRQGIEFFLKRTGKYDEWRQKREEVRRTEKEMKELELSTKVSCLSILENSLYSRAYGDRALKLTLDYFFNNRFVSHRFSRNRFLEIDKLLEKYIEAKVNNRRDSLRMLTSASDISVLTFSNILSELGLKTLSKPWLDEKGEKAARRMFWIEMSVADLAYFWGKNRDVLLYHFRKVENEVDYKRPRYFHVPSRRIESEVYELQDVDFNFEEICEYLEKPSSLIQSAIEKRDFDSKGIIRALDIIYPNEKHDKPYLQKNG